MMKAGLESDDFGTRFCYHYGICIQHNLKVRKIYVLDAVRSSRILIGKQKLGVTFNSDKLGGLILQNFQN